MKKFGNKLRLTLIKNYIEDLYHTDSIWLYENVSDGLKRLKKDLEMVDVNKLNIYCLIDFVEDIEDEMVKGTACLAKTKSRFDNINLLRNLICLEDLPRNVELLMMMVPKVLLFNREICFTIQRFDELKNEIMNCDDETCYKVFNRLVNDLTFNGRMVTDGMENIIRDAKYNPFTLMFGEKDITNEQKEIMKRNLTKLSVKVVLLSEITSHDLKGKYVNELMEDVT